jgi:hypothetical protein
MRNKENAFRNVLNEKSKKILIKRGSRLIPDSDKLYEISEPKINLKNINEIIRENKNKSTL